MYLQLLLGLTQLGMLGVGTMHLCASTASSFWLSRLYLYLQLRLTLQLPQAYDHKSSTFYSQHLYPNTHVSTFKLPLNSQAQSALLPLTSYSAFLAGYLEITIKCPTLTEKQIQKQTCSSLFLSFRLSTFIQKENSSRCNFCW